MTRLVVDASVWVAAADPTDPFSSESRAFLQTIAAEEQPLALPGHTELEVAGALARRLKDPHRGRQLAAGIAGAPSVEIVSLDASLLKDAIHRGTDLLLRAGDALYLSVAVQVDGRVVTWDHEVVERAQGVTPAAWLTEHGLQRPDEASAGPAEPPPPTS